MRADAQQNRSEILVAARAMIVEQGLEFSMRALATRAGVGIATLLRHFPTKDELLFALADDNSQILESLVAGTLEKWEEDPQEALRSFCTAILELNFGALAVVITSSEAVAPLLQSEQALAVRESIFASLERLLERAKSENLIAFEVSPLQFYLGLVAVIRPMPQLTEDIVPDYQNWMIDTYLKGIRP